MIVDHLPLITAEMIFLVLDDGDTFRINESFGSPETRSSIIFSKAKIKFCLGLHYNGDNSC